MQVVVERFQVRLEVDFRTADLTQGLDFRCKNEALWTFEIYQGLDP